MISAQTQRAFFVLGIEPTHDKEAVRRAYHVLVKQYHPDRFHDPQEQDVAQKKLIELNLAYETAMRHVEKQGVFLFQTIPLAQAKAQASRMLEQDEPESALRYLARSDAKDDEWYHLEGRVMMCLKQYAAAHQSFREAVRRSPDNMEFRRSALEAAVAVKRHRHIGVRAAEWVQDVFGKRRKR